MQPTEFPRTFHIAMFIAGALAVVNGRARHVVRRKMRILDTQFDLGVAPTGAGNTTVAIKKNGALIGGATDLSIAATGQSDTAKPSVGVSGEPSGVFCDVGDVITVDVTAICATTAGTDGRIDLLCAAVEA